MATPKKQVSQSLREVRNESDATASAPAYFLSLTVENIRCFGPAQTLDLSNGSGQPARWTVILGDNGVGKTTLLQSLAECTVSSTSDPVRDRLQPVLFESWVLRASSGDFLFRSRRTQGTNPAERVSTLETSIVLGPALKEQVLELTTLTLSIKGVVDETSDDPSFWLFKNGVAFQDISTLVCYAYGATRRMGVASLSEKIRRRDATASLFSDRVALLNAEEWLLQADYAALADSSALRKATQRRDQIREVLISLLPDVSDIRFVRPTSSTSKPRVEVATPYGWVTIRDLSLGYRALIAWVVDLAYRLFERYPDSPNPLAEPAIVLVDEIDLHLHPRWQRTIMSYLTERFPNTQFIVTAHSPLIVQAATDANIVLLRREGDHVVIDNDVEAIRGWRIDQVLTSDLFGLETARPPEYDELMKERNRILGKAKLTKKDEQRLKELDARIGDLPTGETPQDMEAMDVIRRAAEVLKRERADLR